MRGLRIVALVLLLATAMSPVAVLAADHPLRGVALVIGESDYASLPALDNPKRDARAMDDLLDELGFEVNRVLDGDAQKLRDEIASFIEDAKRADVALVYYSGHGVEAGGQNYLIPTDTSLATPQTAGQSLVPVADVLNELAKTVPVTIVLLDACRTNAFPPGQTIELPGTTAPVPVADAGLEAMRGPVPVAQPGRADDGLGVVIGFSASPGQSALDGEPGGNSPYAAALLKHFAAGGDYSFGDLMTMVTEEVYLKTGARQLPWVNSSLRRVLSFGKPAEETAGDEATIRAGRRQLLLTIAAAPDTTRRFVETVANSEGVPLDALYGMLEVLGVDTAGSQQQIEHQLEEGARQLKQFKDRGLGAAKSDPELVRLSALADSAENEGAIKVALGFRERATARARKLAKDRDGLEDQLKADRIEIAATFAEHAEAAALSFEFDVAAQMFGEAYEQVHRWDDMLALRYKWAEGQALKNHGDMKGDNAAFTASIAAYGEALRLAPRDTQPQDWAALENNLGNAYEGLSVRLGDAAMLAQAADAYRAALEVYDKASDPLDWAMTQNNLGIVLTDMSQRETGAGRLEEAVAAFEAALGPRQRTVVPLDWATTQNNLGTALKQLGDRTGDHTVTAHAADAFRAALGEFRQDRTPLDWAMVQNNLGNALTVLGRASRDAEVMAQAIAAYSAALDEYRRERTPLDWAMTQNNMGIALTRLGDATNDTDRIEAGIAAYRAALGEYTRDRVPMQWAMTEANLGVALANLGNRMSDGERMEQAVAALQQALEVYTPQSAPNEWLGAQQELGGALVSLALLKGGDPALLEQAVAADRAAIGATTFGKDGQRWAVLHQSLALALDILSDTRPELLADAIKSAETARQAFIELGTPVSPDFDHWLDGMKTRSR